MTKKFTTQIYYDFDECNITDTLYMLQFMQNLTLAKKFTYNEGAFFLANSELSRKMSRVDHFTILHQPIEDAIQ